MTTPSLLRVVADVGEQLRKAGHGWALVGGLAVSVRTLPRFTHDADIAVGVAADRIAEEFVRGMVARGYHVAMVVEHEATGRLAAARLIQATQGEGETVVGLLFASSGIEAEIADAADEMKVAADLAVPVATVAHLIALKVLSRDDDQRPQDQLDLRGLLQRATDEDVEQARAALELIEARGYGRGRDLQGLLDQALARFPSAG